MIWALVLGVTIGLMVLSLGLMLDLHDQRVKAGVARGLRRMAGVATRWEWRHVPGE